jgi:hypothetical protein
MPKGNGTTFPDWLICEFHVRLPVEVTLLMRLLTAASTESVSTMNEKTLNKKNRLSNLT